MRHSFRHRLINGPFEDPVLHVVFNWQRRAMLFDAGDLRRLNQAEIMKITDIFVSHTHIDHFIGFDTVLRGILRREEPISIYGPSEIIERIEGKLKGYSWNLIRGYPTKIEAFGIDGKSIKHASFHAENNFEKQMREQKPFDGTILDENQFIIKAAGLKHEIDCMAYSLKESLRINIDKAALMDMGLSVGPWLSEFKKALREQAPEDTVIMSSPKSFTIKELRPIAKITEGEKITFVTDASPVRDNIERIISLAKDSDTLYCEACFLDSDIERAAERNHLTAKMAGSIAREADVKELVVVHFSPRYRDNPRAVFDEALEEFGKKI